MTVPGDSPDRLDESTAALLRRLTSPDTPSREERFERLARLASRLFDTPAAWVALHDDTSQHVKGAVGMNIPEPMPLEDTFCQHVVFAGRRVNVPDLTLDDRFAKHPLVTDEGFRAYFGHPLRVRGHVVGTMCVMDHAVRHLSEDEDRALSDFAALAESELLLSELTDAVRADAGSSVLAALRARDEEILQDIDTAICVLDTEGFITFANPRAATLLAVPMHQLIGADFTASFFHTDAQGFTRSWLDTPIAAAIATGTTRRVPLDVLRPGGVGVVEIEYAAAPLVVESHALGAVVTISDISDRRAVERLKDEFVSVVSHELRTPLTSIRGSLGLLNSGKFGELEAQAARLVRIALDNTERLVRLVNDILDLERIEAGRADLHPRLQPLAPILETARDAVAGNAADLNVPIEVSGGEQTLVHADADYLMRALTNLIGNAVKFSPPDQPVTVTATAVDGEVHIAVRDRGRGIPADRLARIFERFEQADLSDSREKGGTGLGLAIARSIVELHDGRIDVTSEPGAGSTFTITLPAAVAPAPRPRAEGVVDVVIVDDDDDLVEVLTAGLHAEGHRVASARGVSEAVGLISRVRPALVVLDVVLADGHGSEVVRQLRENPETASLPVVVASAYDLDDEARARLRLGPTMVIAKGLAGRPLVPALVQAVHATLTGGLK